jgi:hypothetical protein
LEGKYLREKFKGFLGHSGAFLISASLSAVYKAFLRFLGFS